MHSKNYAPRNIKTAYNFFFQCSLSFKLRMQERGLYSTKKSIKRQIERNAIKKNEKRRSSSPPVRGNGSRSPVPALSVRGQEQELKGGGEFRVPENTDRRHLPPLTTRK